MGSQWKDAGKGSKGGGKGYQGKHVSPFRSKKLTDDDIAKILKKSMKSKGADIKTDKNALKKIQAKINKGRGKGGGSGKGGAADGLDKWG